MYNMCQKLETDVHDEDDEKKKMHFECSHRGVQHTYEPEFCFEFN